MVVIPDTDAAGLSPTHDSHIKHTGYESSKKWVCQKKQGEKAKEKLRNGCPLFLDIFSDRRKGSVSYSKKKQTNVRKTGLQLIIPRIIAVLYAISPLGKKFQTFSRRDISPDFEESFRWNIGTSKVSSICQKLHVGHSQPERMVSNGYRWQDRGHGLTSATLKFPESDWKEKSRIIHHQHTWKSVGKNHHEGLKHFYKGRNTYI